MSGIVLSKKRILQLSFPTMLGLSSTTVMGIVNLLMIGHLGYKDIAIVGLVNVFCLNIAMLFGSLGNQVNIEVARDQEKKHVEKVIFDSVIASLLFTLPIILILIILNSFILNFLGLSHELISHGQGYFVIRLLAIILTCISRILIGVLRGLTKMKLTMYITLFANVFNILVSYLSIYVFKTGLIGLGMAMIFSELLQISLFTFGIHSQGYHFLRQKIKRVYRFADCISVYIEGIKIGIQEVGLYLAGFFFTLFVTRLGVKELASAEIALNVLSFAYLPGMAVGITGTVEVSKLVGLKQHDKTPLFLKLKNNLLICAAIFTVPLSLLGGFLGEQIAGGFSNEKDVQKLVIQALFIAMFFLLFDSFQMVLLSANRGFGDHNRLMFISLGLVFGFFVPVSYITTFVLGYGLVGLWLSFYSYIIVQFVVLSRKYSDDAKKYNHYHN